MTDAKTAKEPVLGLVLPFEDKDATRDGIAGLVALTKTDMDRVNAMILSRTGSSVTMIPEVANHLISSGGKRLRPMLTLATANLCNYQGEGHVKLAASVEFMHTATLPRRMSLSSTTSSCSKVAVCMNSTDAASFTWPSPW